jgi:hypothetical protein
VLVALGGPARARRRLTTHSSALHRACTLQADAAQGDERGAEAEATAKAEAEVEEGEEEEEEVPEPEPPRVSVALRRLTDDTVELFAKCELLFACSSPDEARRKVEGAILRVSGLVRRDFGGVVVTDGLLM